MNKSLWMIVALLVASLIAPGAFAGTSKDVFLRDGTVVEGKTIPDGSYTVKWTSTSGATEIEIKRGGAILAHADAGWESRDKPAENDAVVYEKDGSAWKIKEIRFAGKKDVLVLKG